ncbi:MAG: hypothetical protein ACKVQT_02715 [Burkholderiales bacterium]
MCGLCGILGGAGHWTDSRAAPEAFVGREQTHTSARERLDRSALVNQVLRHYRLSLKPWSASSYVLRGGTGKTVLVESLSQMWAAAEAMTGLELDPLDESLLGDLAAQIERN